MTDLTYWTFFVFFFFVVVLFCFVPDFLMLDVQYNIIISSTSGINGANEIEIEIRHEGQFKFETEWELCSYAPSLIEGSTKTPT